MSVGGIVGARGARGALRRAAATTASRVLAAVLAGAAAGAVAKAYAAGGPARRPLAGALGVRVDWSRVAAGARAAAPVAGWAALVLLVAVAVGCGVRAYVLWRESRRVARAGAREEPRGLTARGLTARGVVDGLAMRARAVRRAALAQVDGARAAFRGDAPAPALAAARPRQARVRHTPSSQIHALAAAGASPAEIARRTGLPQDAVTLALSIAR